MLTSEQIKTLINGLKQVIPPFIKPNWGINDPKSPNFIEGRTHHVNDDGTISPLDEKFLPEWPDKYREAAQAQVDAKTVEVFTGGPKEESKTGALSGEVVGEGFGPMWAFIPDTYEISGVWRYYGSSKAVPFVNGYRTRIYVTLEATVTLANGDEYQTILNNDRGVQLSTFDTLDGDPYFTSDITFKWVDPASGLLETLILPSKLRYFPLRGTRCLALDTSELYFADTGTKLSKFHLLKVCSKEKNEPIAWTSSGYPKNPTSIYGSPYMKAPPLYLKMDLENTSLAELEIGEPAEVTAITSISHFERYAFAAIKQVADSTVILRSKPDNIAYYYTVMNVYYGTAPELPEQITNFSWVIRLVPKLASHSNLYLTTNALYIWWDTSQKKAFITKNGPLVAFHPELPNPNSVGPMVLSASPTNNCTPEWTPVLGIKSAQVGQTVRVAARNDLGYPTKWEAVDARGDWNQNDETAPNYIKNRIAYYGDREVLEVMNEVELTFEAEEEGAPPFVEYAVEGVLESRDPPKEVKIIFDGTEYTYAFAYHAFGNLSIWDEGDDTGEPFVCFANYYDGFWHIGCSVISKGGLIEKHTVSLYYIFIPVTPVPIGLLPNEVMRLYDKETGSPVDARFALEWNPDIGLPVCYNDGELKAILPDSLAQSPRYIRVSMFISKFHKLPSAVGDTLTWTGESHDLYDLIGKGILERICLAIVIAYSDPSDTRTPIVVSASRCVKEGNVSVSGVFWYENGLYVATIEQTGANDGNRVPCRTTITRVL